MSRAVYCRQQAALCRGLADQISTSADAKHLRDMATRYETEADGLDGTAASASSKTAEGRNPAG
jgi:hypothetical protein